MSDKLTAYKICNVKSLSLTSTCERFNREMQDKGKHIKRLSFLTGGDIIKAGTSVFDSLHALVENGYLAAVDDEKDSTYKKPIVRVFSKAKATKTETKEDKAEAKEDKAEAKEDKVEAKEADLKEDKPATKTVKK